MLTINFDSHLLLAVTGRGSNGCNTKAQESTHPFVMSLEPLDNHGGNPLLTFIEKQLLTHFALIVDEGSPTDVNEMIARTTCRFDLK
jgi:hypothetical protein